MEHDHQLCGLTCLDTDMLGDIASRLDGSALALTACTCTGLLKVAQDQRLWRQLCYSKWPSTSLPEAQQLLSSSTTASFNKFYADSYPLLSYQKPANNQSVNLGKNMEAERIIYPSDYASFVDVYYKDQCVLSKVIDGLTEAIDCFKANETDCPCDDSTYGRRRWFLNSPFKLSLLNNDQDGLENEESLAHALPSPAQCSQSSENCCAELAEDIRLSWVLLDKKKGKAVNLSSWKPMMVKRSWPYETNYTIQFGSIIPVEESILPHRFAKCVIVLSCRVTRGEEHPHWREISMRVEDLAGAHINGCKSLTILNHSLYCLRSINHNTIKEGNDQFETLKKDLIRSKKLKEKLADWLCLLIEVAIFGTLCYSYVKSPK